MSRMGNSRLWGKIIVLVAVCGWGLSVQAKYGGGEQEMAIVRERILSVPYGKPNIGDLLHATLQTRDPKRKEMRLALLLRKKEVLPVLTERLRTATDDEKYDLLMLIHGQLLWREMEPVVLQLLRDKKLSEHVRGRAATAAALF